MRTNKQKMARKEETKHNNERKTKKKTIKTAIQNCHTSLYSCRTIYKFKSNRKELRN